VKHLSSLHINCLNNISFHRIVSLLSSLLNQLNHFSLKLEADTLVYGSMIISGNIIQKLVIDQLRPMTTYSLHLLLYAENDLEEKVIFNSFHRVEFVQREKAKVMIQECYDSSQGTAEHCFIVFTLPYNHTTLLSHMFSNDFKKYIEKYLKILINILLYLHLDLVNYLMMHQIYFHVLIFYLYMVIRKQIIFKILSSLTLVYHHFFLGR
jgi:hypothetical protein